jgi:hypothetical protein
MSKADNDFKNIVGRYPNRAESQLAPRTGHPLEQTVDWSECPLAKVYPQWEMYLFELGHNPLNKGKLARKEIHNLDGPSVSRINAQFGSCEHKCEEL